MQRPSATMAPDVTAPDLMSLAQQWLETAPARRPQHFPPRLEAAFEADGIEGRRQSLRRASYAGVGLAVLTLPFALALYADTAALVMRLWLIGLLPLALAVMLATHLRLRLSAHEAVIVGGNIIAGLLFSVVNLASRYADPTLYLCGMTMLAIVPGGVRVRAMAVLLVVQLAVFGAVVAQMPAMSALKCAGIVMFCLPITASILVVAQRLEAEIRRNFAIALQERLAKAELAQDNKALDVLAGHDPLTGLGNRRSWDRWLTQQWARHAGDTTPLGLILIDVDYFKKYNDSFGHAAGDECLIRVAATLRDHTGPQQFAARLGGEEFAILLPGLGALECQAVAERVRGAVLAHALPHGAEGAGPVVTISCGVASFVPRKSSRPAQLYAAADAALYAAKDAGRNCVRMSGRTRPMPVRID